MQTEKSQAAKQKPTEGWTWLVNATKWHYFVNARSLCGKWALLFGDTDFEIGNDDSPDNCAACKKQLAKRKTNAAGILAQNGTKET